MQPPSLAPDRYRVLSGSALKVIAVAAMLVDHVAKFILAHYPWFTATRFFLGSKEISAYVLCESFGRIAFPIFCFLLVEGFIHTHDRQRYGLSLLVFAIVSEVVFDLARRLTPLDPSYQNVFLTLLISYLGLCALEDLVGWPNESDIAAAKEALMRDGYQATVFGKRAADLCDALIGIARAGLDENERPFLEPLASLVSQRTTLADMA